MRRPVLVLVAVTVGLLVLASPFLGVKWGSIDHRILPPDSDAYVATREAADRVRLRDGDAPRCCSTAPTRPTCAAYASEVEAVDGCRRRCEPVAEDGDVTLLRATWEGLEPEPRRSQDLVQRDPRVEPASGEALVGGMTAETVDLASSVSAHLPWMGLAGRAGDDRAAVRGVRLAGAAVQGGA